MFDIDPQLVPLLFQAQLFRFCQEALRRSTSSERPTPAQAQHCHIVLTELSHLVQRSPLGHTQQLLVELLTLQLPSVPLQRPPRPPGGMLPERLLPAGAVTVLLDLAEAAMPLPAFGMRTRAGIDPMVPVGLRLMVSSKQGEGSKPLKSPPAVLNFKLASVLLAEVAVSWLGHSCPCRATLTSMVNVRI